MRYILTFVFLIVMSGCSFMELDTSKERLELLHAGVFLGDYGEAEYINDENSTSGIRTISDPTIVCSSKQIPMKLGVSFGVYYKIVGVPESAQDIPVVVETTHPEIVGYSGIPSTVDVWDSDTSHYTNGGHVGGALYTFEAPYELKPGVWSIVVKAFGQEVGSIFNVSSSNGFQFSNCNKI